MDYNDFRALFLAILQGMIAKNGMNMASEGAFRTTVNNAADLALVAEQKLATFRPPILLPPRPPINPCPEEPGDVDPLAGTIELSEDLE